MNNLFKNRSNDMNAVNEWLQLKMNSQFNEEIDLTNSYTIDVDGSGLVLPTHKGSSLNDGQKSYLETFCRAVNELTLEQVKEQINSFQ
ncbi:hypothetical protein NK356_15715 [Chryseobacterium sp. S0630]|uniref:hypothetical protein n=1 Tax=Chryseobacterium sp. S0630 TaxID=2957803 RepID=UPI0020A05743|nr:hypothetical protein [Chryseobacterium sp. S0630]MCP1300622.1 hypothetical protein [Chryseobacterium sp. S0630]